MLNGPSKANPPVETARAGDLVYMSLLAPDAARAARFYGTALGWEYDPSSSQVTNLGHPVGISDAGSYGANTLYCVYGVDDFDAARAATIAAGGRAGDISNVANDGTQVIEAIDDQGVAVLSARPRTPRPHASISIRGASARCQISTVHTPDSARFRTFYGSVLGGGSTPGAWTTVGKSKTFGHRSVSAAARTALR